VDGDDEHAPDSVEIEDLDTTTDPPIAEAEAVEQEAAPVELAEQEAAQVAQPAETQGARRSTWIRTTTKAYEPSMSGSRYSYAVTQLASQGVLNPDAHMFLQLDFYQQAEPNVVAAVMTRLSLKSGLKEWGDKAYYIAAESEMKQLHFRFKPMHWKELTDTQRQTVLESHMFLKKRRDGKIKR
jgi:hypothetical protein